MSFFMGKKCHGLKDWDSRKNLLYVIFKKSETFIVFSQAKAKMAIDQSAKGFYCDILSHNAQKSITFIKIDMSESKSL